MRPILTIAIPTYNRVGKLVKCIENILIQIENKPIEILVSDNASTDNTQEMMETLLLKSEKISYCRNKENIGPDRNFLNCFNKAQGEYVILLGDDDILLPGAIESIIEALKENPVFMHLNTSTILKDDPLCYSAPRRKEEGILKYTDKSEMFHQMGIFVTFMSSLVLKTDLVKEIENKEQYIGTYFIQSHIALQTMKNKGTYVYNTKNCIAASGNMSVGYDLYFVWGKQYHDLLFTTGLEVGIDKGTLNESYKADLNGTIQSFVVHYRQTCKNESDWDKLCMLESVKDYPQQYRWFKVLVYCPRKCLNICVTFKRVICKVCRILFR